MYLLGPRGRSFHPLNLPESTLLEKGCFLLFCQFSIYNGDNELLASIYRLFGPFLSFFGPFVIFSSLKIVYFGSRVSFGMLRYFLLLVW
jgi:hypothetical protein